MSVWCCQQLVRGSRARTWLQVATWWPAPWRVMSSVVSPDHAFVPADECDSHLNVTNNITSPGNQYVFLLPGPIPHLHSPTTSSSTFVGCHCAHGNSTPEVAEGRFILASKLHQCMGR